MTITIGLKHREVESRIIVADSSPLISSADFFLNRGADFRTRCDIGFAFTTSISHIAPRAAGDRALPLLVNRCRFFHINYRSTSTPSGVLNPDQESVCPSAQ